MRLSLVSIGLVSSLTALVSAAAPQQVQVFKFPTSVTTHKSKEIVPLLTSNDAVLNLANQLGISDNFDLNGLQNADSLSVGQDSLFTSEEESERQKLVLIVQGASFSEVEGMEPIFEVRDSGYQGLVKFLSNLPNEYKNVNTLSDSIHLVTDFLENDEKTSYIKKMSQIWNHYFDGSIKYNNKLSDIWSDLKHAFHLSQEQTERDNSIHAINDDSFISEMSQLKFLVEDSDLQSNKEVKTVMINLKSLSNVAKKTGQDSKTYHNSVDILSTLIKQNLVNNVNKFFETIVVVLPDHNTNMNFQMTPTVHHLHKRDTSSSSSSSSGSCYSSEEACLISTSSCSNHGVCGKSGDCWGCQCTASYNDTTKSTTYWQGIDCSKKDVSVEFNLFLWFTVFMAIATILGIKLMYNIGNEELPGVLSAATAAKRSNA